MKPMFDGPLLFLSNMYEVSPRLWIDGRRYASTEHYYQAMKATTEAHHEQVQHAATPHLSKKLGRVIPLRSDWDEIKDSVMWLALRTKFLTNPILRTRLRRTEDLVLVETNFWHDNYWGSCYCPKCNSRGQNKLGIMLMRLRKEMAAVDQHTNICPRLVNLTRESCNVYIGRPSKWGNPFKIGLDGSREDVIRKYEEYLRGRQDLLDAIPELTGRTLGCYCVPQACHGEVLVKIWKEQHGENPRGREAEEEEANESRDGSGTCSSDCAGNSDATATAATATSAEENT